MERRERVWQSTAWSKKLQPDWVHESFRCRLDSSRFHIYLFFSFAYRFIPVHLLNTSDRGQCVHNLTDAAALRNKVPDKFTDKWMSLYNLSVNYLSLLDFNGESVHQLHHKVYLQPVKTDYSVAPKRKMRKFCRQIVLTTKRWCFTTFHLGYRSCSVQSFASGMTCSTQRIRFKEQLMKIKSEAKSVCRCPDFLLENQCLEGVMYYSGAKFCVGYCLLVSWSMMPWTVLGFLPEFSGKLLLQIKTDERKQQSMWSSGKWWGRFHHAPL